MINVDLRRYFTDRIWFGWWYRGWKDDEGGDWGVICGWCRDPHSKLRWTVITLEQHADEEHLDFKHTHYIIK